MCVDKKYEPLYICWYEPLFLGDRIAVRMTPHQRLMYRSLCQAAMFCTSRPYLPDDDNELYLLADADSLEHWKANRDAVLVKFTRETVDGAPVLAHKRILSDWEQILAFNDKQRKRRNHGSPAVTSGDQRSTTGDKVKESKVKESKEERSIPETLPPHGGTDLSVPLDGVWNHYLTATGRSPKLNSFTVIRKRKGLARLKECLSKAGGNLDNAIKLMKLAIDKLAASDFHMGRDQKTGGRKYNDWENHVFRSLEQMEGWWQR